MNTTIKIIFGSSVLINILLIAWLIFKGPVPIQIGYDEKPTRDSINILIKERAQLTLKIDSTNRSYDSLLLIKQTIKTQYYEKIRFIYTASPVQLDSVIRNLSGLKPRYY